MPTIHEQKPQLEALKRELEAGGEMTDTEATATAADAGITLVGAQIDEQGLSWIEVMPTVEKARNGSWYFTVTADDLGTLAEYIQANPDRIPIDYDHAGALAQAGENASTRAAGWFTGEAQVVSAEGRTPLGELQDHASVWAQVKWTPTAVDEIRGGAFRFISPEWGFSKKDPKTGLLTKLRDLVAATLTNRPFFKDMAPVTARELADPEQVEAVSAEYGEAIAELVLAGLVAKDTQDAAESVLAATWTAAYMNDLPDSSFLYISPGGSKDSDGKTTPRSLRHFPVKDANGSPDMAHVRNALARIPQSDVPAAAKAAATAECQRMLKDMGGNPGDMGGNPSATDQGDHVADPAEQVEAELNDPKEIIVADEQPATTDYMRMLGLDETVDPKQRLAVAFRDKDEKILALEQERTELTAKLADADKLNDRVAELETRDRARDIEVFLARAVEKGRVLPAEKEMLAEVFASDVNGLQRLIASRKADMFVLEPKGITGDADRFVDDPDVSEYTRSLNTGGVPVDTEQAKQHLLAVKLLKEQGKTTYTDDEYVAAYEQAATSVY